MKYEIVAGSYKIWSATSTKANGLQIGFGQVAAAEKLLNSCQLPDFWRLMAAEPGIAKPQRFFELLEMMAVQSNALPKKGNQAEMQLWAETKNTIASAFKDEVLRLFGEMGLKSLLHKMQQPMQLPLMEEPEDFLAFYAKNSPSKEKVLASIARLTEGWIQKEPKPAPKPVLMAG